MLVVFPQVHLNSCAICYQNLVSVPLSFHVHSIHYIDDFPLVGVMDWIVFPQNSYAKTLSSNVTGFGVGVFKELIKVKWGIRVGT